MNEILNKRLDELAKKRTSKNWEVIFKQIESLYGYDFARDVFDKAQLYNSSKETSNHRKMEKIDREIVENEFFNKIMSIEYFLKNGK